MNKFEHWCDTCQIRVYIQRHDGEVLNWQSCPFTCEYAEAMRRSMKPQVGEDDYDKRQTDKS